MKKEPKLTPLQATAQGMTTLVGFYGPFPRKRGNCFSVYVGKIETKEDYQRAQSFKIINFNAENLDYLIEQGALTWPIDIVQIDDTYAAKIVDTRIPKEFFDAEPCSICTPKKYWTPEQRKQRADDIRSGVIKIGKAFKLDDGTTMRMERRRFEAKVQPLGFTYTKEVDETGLLDEEGILHSPYLPKAALPTTQADREFIEKYYTTADYRTRWEQILGSLWFRVAYLVTALAAFTFAWYKAVESLLKPH